MQHELELPALRGDSALGFLAALGVLELTALTLDRTPRLSWHGPTGPAILHTHQPFTHESLAGLLQTHVPEKPADEPLPAAPGILSLSRHKADGAATPNEPLRMPIALALQRLREHTNAERLSHSPGARWFTALVNQLNLGPATSGSQPGPIETLYTKTTPLFSPSGQMTLANNWAKAAEHCRHDPTHLLASLTSWRRVEKYAGANLDFGSTGDAHMSSHGKAAQQGVPGATWLALHAFAAFRLTGTARHGRATGWERTPTGPALTWPTWHPPPSPPSSNTPSSALPTPNPQNSATSASPPATSPPEAASPTPTAPPTRHTRHPTHHLALKVRTCLTYTACPHPDDIRAAHTGHLRGQSRGTTTARSAPD